MKYFNFFIALLLILIYLSGTIPPTPHFNLWIVSFIIPFALALNIILMLVGFGLRRMSSVFLLVALIFGGDYLFRTIGIKSAFKGTSQHGPNSFKILNYNVGSFNTGFYRDMPKEEWSRADSLQKSMIEWVLDQDADIQCFQEFPHRLGGGKRDLLTTFKTKYNCFFSADTNKLDRSLFGILIVTRYPIIDSGDVLVSRNGYNRIAFADIDLGSDTIRIINVHLQSMQMKGYHPGYSEDLDGRTESVKIVLRKLKYGVFERRKQISNLIKFIESSPHPVVCVGDFNEMPYSYSYRMLQKKLRNAFEESGRGFGFTYNGNTLGMLRIDNQFYSRSLRSMSFETLHRVNYTDHFPLVGSYLPQSE